MKINNEIFCQDDKAAEQGETGVDTLDDILIVIYDKMTLGTTDHHHRRLSH